jgi:hypothetical protein
MAGFRFSKTDLGDRQRDHIGTFADPVEPDLSPNGPGVIAETVRLRI